MIQYDTQCHNYSGQTTDRIHGMEIGECKHQVTLEGFGRVLCVTLDEVVLVGGDWYGM